MKPFLYTRPENLTALHALVAEHGTSAKILCGGTDLLVRLRMGHARPDVVIDLKRVRDIADDVSDVRGGLRVGARAVMATLSGDARVQRHFPALVEAARVVGSVQIRNRATLAGNICNASPAADTASALLIYDATVNISSARGARHVPIGEFFVGPGKTVLAADEIVESIDLPIPTVPTGAAFGRVTRRYGVDLATINLCCLVNADGQIRFSYGAVAPTPFLAKDLASHGLTARDENALIAEALSQTRPISDVRGSADYRQAMVDVMSRRALHTAVDRLARARGGTA
jgi:carbon-monoxide dehydrogenase medium subunit